MPSEAESGLTTRAMLRFPIHLPTCPGQARVGMKLVVESQTLLFALKYIFFQDFPNQGRDLELSERLPRALRTDNSMDDIFVMVKERMASDSLSQAPLLVLPGCLLQQSQNMLKVANSAECPLQTIHLERERLDELRMLRNAMAVDFPHLTRTLSFYDSMIEERPCSGWVPQLTFFRRATLRMAGVTGMLWGLAKGLGGPNHMSYKLYFTVLVCRCCNLPVAGAWGFQKKFELWDRRTNAGRTFL